MIVAWRRQAMRTIDTSFPVNRRLLFSVAAGIAAETAAPDVRSQPREATRPRATLDAAFAAPRQIDAGLLNVGYVELGPPGGRAVLLLHGWPYDIHAYAAVAPLLAERGFRVIIPHLRGY